MPNTLITPVDVIRDAALFLQDNLLIANLVNRGAEEKYGTAVGNTIKVKGPANLGEAREFTSTTTADDIVETSVDVVLEKHFYKRVSLTSAELTLSIEDFTAQVVLPAVRSLIFSIEKYLSDKIVGGFARFVSGTQGTTPDSHQDILSAEKTIFDNKGDISNLVGLITSQAHLNFAKLNIFTSMDYGAERPEGLRSNSLGKMSGIEWFRSPNAYFTRGDFTGTITSAAASAGATTLTLSGFSTGTFVNEGARFTVTGSSATHTVIQRATISSNSATVTFTPGVTGNITNGASVTFQTALTPNVVYNPVAVYAAILPGAPLGKNSAQETINGIGLRIINLEDVSTLTSNWVFDVYCGARVVRPEFGCVMQKTS